MIETPMFGSTPPPLACRSLHVSWKQYLNVLYPWLAVLLERDQLARLEMSTKYGDDQGAFA